MAKQKIDWTEAENNYINYQNNYCDESANVFYRFAMPTGYKVYAKPVEGSKGSYTFKQKNENDAYFLARDLMDKSVGYSFEVRNKRVLCKPTTSKATLVLELESLATAIALVKYLREQEVINRRKYNATKGFSLVKKMIADNLTEQELYESLYDSIDETLETDGAVVIGNSIFFDGKTAKRKIATDDLHKQIDKATDKYQETIDSIGY